MRPQSAKAKGRRGQQRVRDAILMKFPDLEPGDVRSTGMGQSGNDIQLSPAAQKKFPFAIEVKTLAAFAGYKHLEQANAGKDPNMIPIAVVKANHKQPMVLMYLDDFMEVYAHDPTKDSISGLRDKS